MRQLTGEVRDNYDTSIIMSGRMKDIDSEFQQLKKFMDKDNKEVKDLLSEVLQRLPQVEPSIVNISDDDEMAVDGDAAPGPAAQFRHSSRTPIAVADDNELIAVPPFALVVPTPGISSPSIPAAAVTDPDVSISVPPVANPSLVVPTLAISSPSIPAVAAPSTTVPAIDRLAGVTPTNFVKPLTKTFLTSVDLSRAADHTPLNSSAPNPSDSHKPAASSAPIEEEMFVPATDELHLPPPFESPPITGSPPPSAISPLPLSLMTDASADPVPLVTLQPPTPQHPGEKDARPPIQPSRKRGLSTSSAAPADSNDIADPFQLAGSSDTLHPPTGTRNTRSRSQSTNPPSPTKRKAGDPVAARAPKHRK